MATLDSLPLEISSLIIKCLVLNEPASIITIIPNPDAPKALQHYMLKQNRRIVHLGALSTIFMIVFPIFFQQALETRLKLIEDIGIPCNLTYGTDYTSLDPVYIQDEGQNLNSTFKGHS